MRQSGVLMHVTSLPSRGGIGTLGQAAYDFVDFVKSSGMTIWQMLPIGPTGYAESPYQSVSTFAGNPLMIDPDALISDGILPADGYTPLPAGDRVDFEAVKAQKQALLRKAYESASAACSTDKVTGISSKFVYIKFTPFLRKVSLICSV